MTTYIARHEVAPKTEEEWEQALAAWVPCRNVVCIDLSRFRYGCDREEDPLPPKVPPSAFASGWFGNPADNVAGPSSRPLIHHVSSDEYLDHNSYHHHSSSSNTRPQTPRSSFGSESGLPGLSSQDSTLAFGIAGTIGAPPTRGPSECARILASDDGRPGRLERARLREFYEREGWLPGPTPSRKTQIRRKQASSVFLSYGWFLHSQVQETAGNVWWRS
jgi:hypothetical protein